MKRIAGHPATNLAARRGVRRLVATVATATAIVVATSGCFVIPLADGRSPFDNPFGPSNKDIAEGLPVLQAALDVSFPTAQWQTTVERHADNCEGACNLKLVANLTPTQTYAEATAERVRANGPSANEEIIDHHTWQEVAIPVPEDVFKAAARTVIETADRLDIPTMLDTHRNRDTASEDAGHVIPELCTTIETHFATLGSFPSMRNADGQFVGYSDPEARFFISWECQFVASGDATTALIAELQLN